MSPATKNDWWLNDGAARYSEALYVQHVAGEAGFEEVTKDMSVGALAYVSVPLADISHLDTFSPEFQSLVTDKGGMILEMLHWVIGDEAFDKTMRTFVAQYSGKSVTVDDFRAVAEQVSGQQLTWFFTQWLNSTGAPEFKNKYTVYRTQKGFRVVGEISQDMDLFRMPVELRVDTDGKTETKRIEVEGTNSAYVVETFGKPRRITIDPNSQVLQNSQTCKCGPRSCAAAGCGAGRPDGSAQGIPEGAGHQREQLAGALPHRRSFLPAAQLSIGGKRVSRGPEWRRRTALDRGLEPHPAGHDLRPDRPARTRNQRIPSSTADQRQHAECARHRAPVFAEALSAF